MFNCQFILELFCLTQQQMSFLFFSVQTVKDGADCQPIAYTMFYC